MAKFKEKNEALSLRKEGYSIGDIARKLVVSKSTVSEWCKDIALTNKAIARIAKKSQAKSTSALLQYSELVRKRRQDDTIASTQKGKNDLGKLSNRDIFCVGLGLYWGEGYKKGSQEFGFTNSDSGMVRFYVEWLQTVFGIKKSNLIFRVSINNLHKHRVRAVERYWAQLIGVPLEQFTKISLIQTQSKKIYTNLEHMGTLRIKVRKGTHLRREVLGSIAGIVQQI